MSRPTVGNGNEDQNIKLQILNPVCVCGTVLSMLSGLKTSSFGLNTLGTT